ncbi:AAA ATPase [Trifolium repens]|nr:FtsH extracellular protease family [Trifolium repens]WJX46517.1 AAA ATPase [Trifolium repens]
MLAAGDLQQITQIARQMVTMYGMCEIGPWTLTDPTTQSSDVVLRMLARNSMSEKLAGYKVTRTVMLWLTDKPTGNTVEWSTSRLKLEAFFPFILPFLSSI